MLSPRSRRAAIEQGRAELNRLYEQLPDGAYDLSLRDLVEQQHSARISFSGGLPVEQRQEGADYSTSPPDDLLAFASANAFFFAVSPPRSPARRLALASSTSPPSSNKSIYPTLNSSSSTLRSSSSTSSSVKYSSSNSSSVNYSSSNSSSVNYRSSNSSSKVNFPFSNPSHESPVVVRAIRPLSVKHVCPRKVSPRPSPPLSPKAGTAGKSLPTSPVSPWTRSREHQVRPIFPALALDGVNSRCSACSVHVIFFKTKCPVCAKLYCNRCVKKHATCASKCLREDQTGPKRRRGVVPSCWPFPISSKPLARKKVPVDSVHPASADF